MNTKLEIHEIPTGSCNTLRLVDNSYYIAGFNVTNAILEITPPGAKCPVVFEVSPNFTHTSNSATLKIAPAASFADLTPLPDGVYLIKYSVNPNLTTFVEYKLFRNCRLLNQYAALLCRLFTDRVKLTKREFEEKRRQLIWVKEVIDASKYTLEMFGDEDMAIELYNEANKLIKDINEGKC